MGKNSYPICRVENRHRISSFNYPIFGEETFPIFDMRLQIRLTSQHVAKFGWVLLRDKFMKFRDDLGDPL